MIASYATPVTIAIKAVSIGAMPSAPAATLRGYKIAGRQIAAGISPIAL